MTTDAEERAARLAALRERRSAADSSSSPPVAAAAPTTPGGGGRRRSPATTAKIATVGASATAVLGMMAGYGMADRADADAPTLEAAPQPVARPPAPVATSVTPTTQPQVVVVVIDGATGLPISSTAQSIDVLDIRLSSTSASQAPESIPVDSGAPASTSPNPTPTPTTAPAPVAVPVAIDVAVPAPPPPRPAAPAPQPQPQPQAESGGS